MDQSSNWRAPEAGGSRAPKLKKNAEMSGVRIRPLHARREKRPCESFMLLGDPPHCIAAGPQHC